MSNAPRAYHEQPTYRLLSPCYLEDDTLHVEGEEIIYLGIPNEEMEPLNEAARAASTAYLEHLDDAARTVAAHRNLPFMGRNAMIDQAFEHAHRMAGEKKAVVLPTSRDDIPVRPDLATASQRLAREQKSPRKVLGSKAPTPRKVRQGPPQVLGQTSLGPAVPTETV